MHDLLVPLYKALAWLLAFFYSLVPDLGVAIILLTVVIMLLVYPLVVKQTKSMIAMQRINPELQRLRQKHKDDKAKLNEETMRLFQERKINPMASCLPFIPQMIVFFVLNVVLRSSYKYVPESGGLAGLYRDFCGGDISKKACEKLVDKGSAGNLGFLSPDFLNLHKSAVTDHGSVIHYVPYFALVVGVAVASYLMSRQSMKRTAAPNPQMAAMMKVLPVLFAFFSLNFASGLVLYFFVSSVWRLGQQELIYHRHINDPVVDVISPKGVKTRTATAVIDVEGRETDNGQGSTATPDPVTPVAKPRAPRRPTPVPEMRATEGTRVADTAPGSRGLRGLFRPPAPATPGAPGSNTPKGGTQRPIAKSPGARAPGSNKPGARPTGTGNNKKKKR